MTSIRWAAQLPNVCEVSLSGTADLGFWTDQLEAEELTPLSDNGRAALSIISAVGRFAGLTFRETSVSVVIEPANGPGQIPAFFLVQAFNSNRFFAWCERVLFATPYEYAAVNIQHQLPSSIQVARQRHVAFVGSMSNDAGLGRLPTEERMEQWVGKVLLPSQQSSAKARPKGFFARIAGATRVYPFQEGEDRIELRPFEEDDVFQALLSSSFTPQQWVVRSNATHAKSKTYSRDEMPALESSLVGG